MTIWTKKRNIIDIVYDNATFYSEIILFIFSGVLILILPILYSLIPLMSVPTLGQYLQGVSFPECLAKYNTWLTCDIISLPTGTGLNFGLPSAILMSLPIRSIGLSAHHSYQLVTFLYLLIGGSALVSILRLLKVRFSISLFFCLIFFSLPIIYAKAGYVFMMLGFMMSPILLWIDIQFMKSEKFYFLFPFMTFIKTMAIFQDPYSYVIFATFSGVSTLYLSFRVLAIKTSDIRLNTLVSTLYLNKKILSKPLLLFLSVILPILLYRTYLGWISFPIMSLDFFRGQGIDLIAFIARTEWLYFFSLPISGVGNLNPKEYFTDGEMVFYSYIGLGFIIGLVGYCWQFNKSSIITRLLLVTMLITLILSLGPALKVNDKRNLNIEEKNNIFTSHSYTMPKEMATYEFPWAKAFRKLPGLKNMRAVSRWYLFVALALVIFSALFAERLFSLKYYFLAILFSLWIGLEYFPNVAGKLKKNTLLGTKYQELKHDLLSELRELNLNSSRVVFVQPKLANEFFSNFLCIKVGCHTYNVSTDKALALAQSQWPDEIRNLLVTPNRKIIAEVFQKKLVEAVIVPHFDMRWDSYSWPPKKSSLKKRLVFANSLNITKLKKKQGKWFTVYRQ